MKLLQELMALYESGIGIQSAISQLQGLTGDMLKLYPQLQDIIRQGYLEHDDSNKYIKFMSGRLRGKWFAQNYLSTRNTGGMKQAFVTLSQTILRDSGATRTAAALNTHMDKDIAVAREETGSKNFQRLETLLPVVLADLAKKSPDHRTSLLSLAKRIQDEGRKLVELKAHYERIASDEAKSQEPEKPKSSVGSQNQQVEMLVAQVLGSLPDKKAANEIRTILARSDNKLAVLQQELTKRGFKL